MSTSRKRIAKTIVPATRWVPVFLGTRNFGIHVSAMSGSGTGKPSRGAHFKDGGEMWNSTLASRAGPCRGSTCQCRHWSFAPTFWPCKTHRGRMDANLISGKAECLWCISEGWSICAASWLHSQKLGAFFSTQKALEFSDSGRKIWVACK